MFPSSQPFLEKLVDFLYCLLETTRKYLLMLLFQAARLLHPLAAVCVSTAELESHSRVRAGETTFTEACPFMTLLQIKESLLGKAPLGGVAARSLLQPV